MQYYLIPIFLLLSCGPLLSQSNHKKHERNAEHALSEKDFYRAAREYRNAWESKKSNKEYLYKSGKYFLLAKDYFSAEQSLKQIIGETRSFPKVQYYHAMALKGQGRYDAAVRGFRSFIDSYNERDKQKYQSVVQTEIYGCEKAIKDQNKITSSTIQAVRLPDNVNTIHQEFAPVVGNGKMYFSSNKTGELKIYSTQEYSNNWSTPIEAQSLPLIKSQNFSNGSFTPDMKRFYFSLCEDNPKWNENNERCKIYYSERLGSTWSEPLPLPKYINPKEANNTHAFVCYDGESEVLYFISNRSGGQGGYDIWFSSKSIREGVDAFSFPQNAGKLINTPYNEKSPFYDSERGILYYSSEGKVGYGGQDIYRAEGSKKDWLSVGHLESPINSSADDLFFVPSINGSKNFMVSNRKVGTSKLQTLDYDLFEIKTDAPRNKAVNVKAIILNSRDYKPVYSSRVNVFKTDDQQGRLIKIHEDFLNTPGFSYNYIPGEEYLFVVEAANYQKREFYMSFSPMEDNTTFQIGLMPVGGGYPIDNTPVDPIPEPVPEPNLENDYRIQVAAVKSTNIDKYRYLEEFGLIKTEKINGKNLTRILIAGFENTENAKSQLAKLKKKYPQHNQAFIVRYKNGVRTK